jgi:hypothetical protein
MSEPLWTAEAERDAALAEPADKDTPATVQNLARDIHAAVIKRREPKEVTVTRKCTECGHEQKITSAASVPKEDGSRSYYFGSDFDFCDKCDGPMETTAIAHEIEE